MIVSPLIGDIPTTTVTIRTFGAPSIDVYGRVSATPTDTVRTAVVHPTGRRELARLPEADRARELISVYLTEPIDVARSTQTAQVVYQGRTYEVLRVGDYSALGDIYLVTAALIDEVAP